MTKKKADGPDKASRFRPVEADEFGNDRLPEWSKFGPIEVGFFLGHPATDSPEPRYLARYHRLPAYLGSGTNPMGAMLNLQSILATNPILCSSNSERFSRKNLESRFRRIMSAMVGAAKVGGGKRSSDRVSQIAVEENIATAAVHKMHKQWREKPEDMPLSMEKFAAGAQLLDGVGGKITHDGPGPPRALNAAGMAMILAEFSGVNGREMALRFLVDRIENQFHPWEWECDWALRKIAGSEF